MCASPQAPVLMKHTRCTWSFLAIFCFCLVLPAHRYAQLRNRRHKGLVGASNPPFLVLLAPFLTFLFWAEPWMCVAMQAIGWNAAWTRTFKVKVSFVPFGASFFLVFGRFMDLCCFAGPGLECGVDQSLESSRVFVPCYLPRLCCLIFDASPPTCRLQSWVERILRSCQRC